MNVYRKTHISKKQENDVIKFAKVKKRKKNTTSHAVVQTFIGLGTYIIYNF